MRCPFFVWLLSPRSAPSAPAAPSRLSPRHWQSADPAPDFKLPGVDGKDYTLASFADAKLLLVVFTCNHCPTAQAYEERIAKLHADYEKRGVALVAISPNDAQAVRLDELGYTDVGEFAGGHEAAGQGAEVCIPVSL